MIKRLRTKLACRIRGHNFDDGVYLGRTGKLSFSFNCARPQIAFNHTCERCGIVERRTAMSGLKSFELTPDVCAKVLEDEFGVPRDRSENPVKLGA